MIYLLIVLAFFLGYYLREIRNYLIAILDKVSDMKLTQDKPKTPEMGFAEPLTRAELAALNEDEKIRLLNP